MLTDSERGEVSRAKVAASQEVDSLVRIIERLAGEIVVPADETPPDRDGPDEVSGAPP